MSSRYKKISVRMWGDSGFKRLSRPQPNAQSLWVYLLTGPHTNSIPGLFSIGEAALAEAMGWPLKGFREAFAEVLREGMAKADFASRVIWLPKSIFHNPPESPNVVKSWRIHWNEIPECSLKVEAHQHLKAFLEGSRKGTQKFIEAFLKACPEPFAKPSPNQEQEQEQEQYQEQEQEERAKRQRQPFSPPSLEEVRAYLSERNSIVDAEAFVAYYTANGWKVGKNPMRDWKAAIVTWERNDLKALKKSPSVPTTSQPGFYDGLAAFAARGHND